MLVLSNVKLSELAETQRNRDLWHKDSIKSDIELNNDYCENIQL